MLYRSNNRAGKNKLISNWDNIRYFLSAAREGSLSGAARQLDVNHSTVLRRLASLEEEMKVQLFSRDGNDRTLTQAGFDMMPFAEQIERSILELERHLEGRDSRLSGTVRLTTTDTLATTLVPSLITAFRAEYQEIQIKLIVDNNILKLSYDADVSLRPARAPEEDLVGRPICRLAAAIFTSETYLESQGLPASAEELWQRDWVVPDLSLERYPVTGWLRARVNPERIAASSTSVLTMAASVKSGMGFAVLPCFLGDTDSKLIRVSEPIDEVTSKLWLLTHRDLRECARFRVFRDFALQYLSRYTDVIEGRNPTAGCPGDLLDTPYFSKEIAPAA